VFIGLECQVTEPIGNAGKPRIIATAIDTAFAMAVGVGLAACLPGIEENAKAIIAIVLYLGYFLVFESVWSRTPGKLVCGLTVQRLDGKPPGWREGAIRTAFRLFEVNPVLLGALPAGLAVMCSPRRQRLGDIVAKTVVAKAHAPSRGTANGA
jgi:uncharacterized RDD family membrane protein YckC